MLVIQLVLLGCGLARLWLKPFELGSRTASSHNLAMLVIQLVLLGCGLASVEGMRRVKTKVSGPAENADTNTIKAYFKKEYGLSDGAATGAAWAVQTLDPDAGMQDFFENEFCGGFLEPEIKSIVEPKLKTWMQGMRTELEKYGKSCSSLNTCAKQEKLGDPINDGVAWAYAIDAKLAKVPRKFKMAPVTKVYNTCPQKRLQCAKTFMQSCKKDSDCCGDLRCQLVGKSKACAFA